MKRSERQESDSFDLFLDTVCNTFGGIVFIAILVALMAKMRQSPSELARSNPPVTAVAMAGLELELEFQQDRQRQLQATLDAIPPPGFDPELTHLVNLSEQLSELNSANRSRRLERDRIGEQLVEIAKKTLELDYSLESPEARFKSAVERLAATKAKWQIVKKTAGTTLQVPRERAGYGAQGMILLSGNELFLVSSPDDGPGEFFDKHVKATKIGDKSYVVEPYVGKGIVLGGPKSISAIRGTTERISRSGSTLIIVVYPDSYHQFGPVRDACKAVGMNYELWIKSEGESLEVSYGAGRGRIQ